MAEAGDKKSKEAKVKRPSAQKRHLQSQKRRLHHRSFRATVSTAMRNFEQSLEQKEASELVKAKLDAVFSLMDKGVKKSIFKLNKAARTKSRLSARVV